MPSSGACSPAPTSRTSGSSTSWSRIPQRELAQPVVFVDLVSSGSTFAELFGFLRAWIEEERAQWDVIRRKLRFVGITEREHTSLNTWRWHQDADWPAELPARAGLRRGRVRRRSCRASGAAGSSPSPSAESCRQGLAEAVALVERGARRETRAAIALSNRALAVFLVIATVIAVPCVVIWLV